MFFIGVHSPMTETFFAPHIPQSNDVPGLGEFCNGLCDKLWDSIEVEQVALLAISQISAKLLETKHPHVRVHGSETGA
jgi:hypothetical protein